MRIAALLAALACACSSPPPSTGATDAAVPASARHHALAFDGFDDEATISTIELSTAAPLSVELWLWPRGTGLGVVFFQVDDLYDASAPGMVLTINDPATGSGVYVTLCAGGCVSTSLSPVETWWHLAFTIEPVTPATRPNEVTVKMYVNGVLVDEEPGAYVPSIRNIYLGCHGLRVDAGVDYCRPFDVAELRIWDHVRDAMQIATNRNHHVVGDEPGLMLHAPLTEGTGSLSRMSGSRARHLELGTGGAAPAWSTSHPSQVW